MSWADLRALLYLTGVVAVGSLLAKVLWWGVLSYALP